MEIPEGRGGYHFFEKMENPGRWGGGGVLSELPSMVGVWIFSGTTHYTFSTYMHWSLIKLKCHNKSINHSTIMLHFVLIFYLKLYSVL